MRQVCSILLAILVGAVGILSVFACGDSGDQRPRGGDSDNQTPRRTISPGSIGATEAYLNVQDCFSENQLYIDDLNYPDLDYESEGYCALLEHRLRGNEYTQAALDEIDAILCDQSDSATVRYWFVRPLGDAYLDEVYEGAYVFLWNDVHNWSGVRPSCDPWPP